MAIDETFNWSEVFAACICASSKWIVLMCLEEDKSGGRILSICKQPSTVVDKLGNKRQDPWPCYLGALSDILHAFQPVCVIHVCVMGLHYVAKMYFRLPDTWYYYAVTVSLL